MRRVLLLLCVLATACGAGNGEGEKRTVIVFSYDEGGALKEAALDVLIERFEQAHPEYRIQKHSLPGVTEMERTFYLTSLGAGSNFVDLFELDPIWTSEFAAGELILPLDDFADQEFQGAYLPAALEAARYNGALYALPYYATYGGLFYRTDLMDAFGFSPPKTWEELVKQAKAVTGRESVQGLLWQGQGDEGLVCNTLEFYYSSGGEVRVEEDRVVFDRASLVRTLSLMQDLIYLHGVSPEDVLDHFGEDSEEIFGEGGALFMINTQAAARYLAKDKVADRFSIAPLPGSGVALMGGWHLAVNRNSAQPRGAFAFASFLTSQEAQRFLFEKRGQGPVRRSFYEESGESPQREVLRVLGRTTRSRPASPFYQPWSRMLAEEVRLVLRRDKSPEEGAEAIMGRSFELDFPSSAPPDFKDRIMHWY